MNNESQALEDANEQLKQRLSTLTRENETLLKRTFELTDELATLRSPAASHRHTPVLQRMLAHHVNRLPLHSEAPNNLLFDLLGCTPTAYTEVLQENIRVLLHTLRPDKNKAVETRSPLASRNKTRIQLKKVKTKTW